MKYQLKARNTVSFMVNTSEIIDRKVNGEVIKTYKDAASITTVTLQVGSGELKADEKVLKALAELPTFLAMVAEGDLFIEGDEGLAKLHNSKNAVKSARQERLMAEQKRRKELSDQKAESADELAATKAELAELKKEFKAFQKAVGE